MEIKSRLVPDEFANWLMCSYKKKDQITPKLPG
jgi:hypothetical protein